MDKHNAISLKYQCDDNKFDKKKQLPINSTVTADSDDSNIDLRKERFSAPIPVLISTTTISQNDRTLHLADHDGRDFVTAYSKYAFYKFLTLMDIVEEAAVGIIEEGTKIGQKHKAERLAEQLRAVKHFSETSRTRNKIPPEIGQACVFLYTMENFWYKLINSTIGNPHMINATHLTTLGPFCYLLKTYLRSSSTENILTVYRGLTLTETQIQQHITTDSCFNFTSFTSTSTNRALAEIYGNTLFIIDLNVINAYGDGNIRVGAYIASLSNFPTEEEFLIWPSTVFKFVKYEFNQINNKYIIYLKSSCVSG